MIKETYGIGDPVFLVDGPTRTGRPEGEFKIVACLPDVNGMSQYRVKSISESFERRIVGTDIDTDRSQKPRSAKSIPSAPDLKGAWLKTSTIKVGKSS